MVMIDQQPQMHQQFNQQSWQQQQPQQPPQQYQFRMGQQGPQSISTPPTPGLAPHQQMPPPGQQPNQQMVPPQSPQLGHITPSSTPGPIPHHFHPRNHHIPHQQQQQPPQHFMQNQPPQHHHHHQHPIHAHPPHIIQQQQQQTPHPPAPNQFININLPLHLQPDYRIYEMNKRLSSRPEQLLLPQNNLHYDSTASLLWYESFVNEFFDDSAKLSIRNFLDENGNQKNFTLSRSLIPRFFRSFSDGGCTDLFFHIHRSQIVSIQPLQQQQQQQPPVVQNQTPQLLIYESDQCIMNTKHGRPMFANIYTEGNLTIEFVIDNSQPNLSDQIKIKNFNFYIRRHQELIPRSAIAILQDPNPNLIDQLSRNITKMGLTMTTLNFLKICSILEPMQELMLKHKLTGMPPRECLRTSVVQRINQARNSSSSGLNQPVQGQQHLQQRNNIDDLKPNVSNPNQSPNAAEARTPAKRRKRKQSPGGTPNTNEIKKEPGSATKSKKAAAAVAAAAQQQQQQLQQQAQQQQAQPMFNTSGYMPQVGVISNGDVMVVGEPSLMGGDFGEEDERLITRLENNQFEMNNINMVQPGQMNQMQHMKIMQRNNSNNLNNNSYQPFQDENNKQQIQLMSPSNQLNNEQRPPTRPPSSLLPPPPRPQSNSHFINSGNNLIDTRSSTPSPSTSNLMQTANINLAPKPPTPQHPPPSLTPQQSNQIIDLNINGGILPTATSSSSSPSPSLNNSSIINGLNQSHAQAQTQQQLQPSTSTSSSAIASSSSSSSPNSLFNSNNNSNTNNNSTAGQLSTAANSSSASNSGSVLSPSQANGSSSNNNSNTNKPINNNNDQSQQQQQSFVLNNF